MIVRFFRPHCTICRKNPQEFYGRFLASSLRISIYELWAGPGADYSQGGGAMKCTRCCGLMVADNLLDLQESYLPMWMRALRCIACGNIEDPLIHRHRAGRQAKATKVVEPRQPAPASFRPAKAA
jgi:hypothetical protein